MTKEDARLSVMGAISMALKDPILQQGFEIICKENAELEAQIEKMKCCDNCKNGELSAHEEPCRHCQRCFVSVDVKDQENVSDKWELEKND